MRGRLTFSQMLLAMLLGVAGGVYIYKPLFEPPLQKQNGSKDKLQETEGRQR
ncbi:protein PIGBOS1 [Hemicordylus capensis]|uniref:protein PIGBOS1 n=1 Tax=Hemicordylus capensis TaxID=884348 RepID=UPI00230229CD|nr:protein PIGBOS1 [Hemicordylus capensis]